ncbi:hypothetical protein RUND412_007348 [Rhizina undulata]
MDQTTIRDSTVNNDNNRVVNNGNTNANNNNIDINISRNTINCNIITATALALNTSNNDNGVLGFYSQDFRARLPFRRNPNFCGRQDIVERLRQLLEPQDLTQYPPLGSRPARKTVVLHGMGGVGKSQVALEYAHHFAHCYTSTIWIDANDLSSTTESACKFVEQLVAHYVSKSGSAPIYQAISNVLGIPDKIDSSGRVIKTATYLAIETIHNWLGMEKNRGWLLLVDNYDKAEEEELEKLIPTCDWGSVLVTTRLANLDRFGKLVEVEELGSEAGLALLLKSSGKYQKPLNESEIVKTLGELPLALDQAGAYIKFLRILFSDYRDKLEKGLKASFKKNVQGFGLPSDKASVLTTWMLSFEELSEEAKKLLFLCAFLSNEDIPNELFRRGSSAVGWIKCIEEEDRFEDTVGELFAFSLAQRRDASDDSFCIHPLVQTWAREQIDNTLRFQNVEDAITLVGSAIGGGSGHERSSDDWIFERRILSHLRVCHDNISKYFKGSNNRKVSSASMAIGQTYKELGYYKQAEALYRIALVGREKALGEDHLDTLSIVDNMASVFEEQGQYNRALEWYHRALVGKEKALGTNHPSTLKTVNNMASVFYEQGQYDGALKWYHRALVGKGETLGKDHHSTLNTVNNMALVFDKKGQYDKALEWYQRALAGYEKLLGKDHPSTLKTVNNIAVVFDLRGRYDEALDLYQRALAGKEKALGIDHPSTLNTVNNMAVVFNYQGRYNEALEWHQRALVAQEKILGKDHPSTLSTVKNMASVFKKLGRNDEALESYKRAVAGKERTLGKYHPSTLRTVEIMASFFNNLGRYDEELHLKKLYEQPHRYLQTLFLPLSEETFTDSGRYRRNPRKRRRSSEGL